MTTEEVKATESGQRWMGCWPRFVLAGPLSLQWKSLTPHYAGELALSWPRAVRTDYALSQ